MTLQEKSAGYFLRGPQTASSIQQFVEISLGLRTANHSGSFSISLGFFFSPVVTPTQHNQSFTGCHWTTLLEQLVWRSGKSKFYNAARIFSARSGTALLASTWLCQSECCSLCTSFGLNNIFLKHTCVRQHWVVTPPSSTAISYYILWLRLGHTQTHCSLGGKLTQRGCACPKGFTALLDKSRHLLHLIDGNQYTHQPG